jgi:hypothetical protein
VFYFVNASDSTRLARVKSDGEIQRQQYRANAHRSQARRSQYCLFENAPKQELLHSRLRSFTLQPSFRQIVNERIRSSIAKHCETK